MSKKISKNDLAHDLGILANRLFALEAKVEKNHEAVKSAVNTSTEVVGALVSLADEKVVAAEVERLRAERKAAAEQKAADSLKALVEKGILIPAETSTKGSLLVGQDGPDGGVSSRRQFEVSQVLPEFLEQYIGLKVGSEIKNNGATFTVSEIYEIDQTKVAAEVAAQAAAAQAAAESQKAE